MKIASLIFFVSVTAQAATVNVQINTSQNRRPINTDIYGVNFGTAAQFSNPGYTVRRWGGNSTTRYNWQFDGSNKANDYVYLNYPEGNGLDLPNNSTANQFLSEAISANAKPILTVGTIGWTPIGDRNKHWGFSINTYGAQFVNGCPFDCDAGNGECSSANNTTGFCVNGKIVGNNPLDTSFASGPSWVQNWITHLRSRHGTAANGGVKYFALDNEVMLWNSTHRDVHPNPATYDEIWQKTVDYASAIKLTEPNAKIFGPVTWGYCDLFGSAADNCLLGPDRTAHGGVPFVQWFLRQVCAHQQTTGTRLIDYLDLHYYPQGNDVVDFGGNLAVSENTANSAKRLRSIKELYDPSWVPESWMADLGDNDQYHYNKPQILRRARAWIDAECPGTQLAITEYNWGPDQGLSAALAQAEVLALFAREGVDLATRWVAPTANSMVERAFKMMLNYDGAGNRYEGDSVFASSSDIDLLGAYAADIPGARTMVLLINKDVVSTNAPISFSNTQNGVWKLYRLDANTNVAEVASSTINGTSLTLNNLPARSINLLVLPSSSVSVNLFANGFE